MRSPIPVPRRLTFFVHASSLEQGGVAEDDLAQFEITDPHTSRFWQIRTGQFDGRQYIDMMPPELFAVLTVDDRDERTSEEQDVALCWLLSPSGHKLSGSSCQVCSL
jgi:hypothetical protein